MDKNDKNKKYIYDEKKKQFVHDDGVEAKPGNVLEDFNLYYSWVCEKVEKDKSDYYAWKEMLGFLSLEKYRAYVEKDDVRMKLLEMGMLKYITEAVKTGNWRICILGFRQAIRWGYPSALIYGNKKFKNVKRYLRFLYKIAKRYYIESSLEAYNVRIFAMMGKFDDFMFSILALSMNKKRELLAFGTETLDSKKTLFYSDSAVSWDWLMDEFDKAKNENEFKKSLNIIHITLSDYFAYELKKSSDCTFDFWKDLIKNMNESDKEWVQDLAKEEEVLYKKMKNKYAELFDE